LEFEIFFKFLVDEMKKAIIAAPFGSYLSLNNATSTRGTYTYDKRPGAIWGAMSRIHYTRKGLVNAIGMKNPGIRSQNFDKYQDVIWSIAGFDYLSWINVIHSVPASATVELNFSCPNVKMALSADLMKTVIETSVNKFERVIVKLPPEHQRAINLWHKAASAGVRAFNCCNTIKTDKGGLSGRAIQEHSLPLIKLIKRHSRAEGLYVNLIGGGGIYAPDDVKRYRESGADYFSLATIFMLYPWRVPSVMREIYL